MEIRQIKENELSLIHLFLENYWKKGHSLTKSKSLLDFQHLGDGQYNFFAAIEGETVWALQGFIPTTLYDSSLEKGDAWGAIWKIRDDAPDKMAGIELLDRIGKEYGFHSIGAIGISGIAKKIYKMVSWETGYLHQYYIANESNPFFSVMKLAELHNDIHQKPQGWHIDCKMTLSGLPKFYAETYNPLKSVIYFVNRYERHPIYRYNFWCVYNGQELKSVWAVRRHVVNGSSIFRIVDILGRVDGFPDLYCYIQEILKNESAEYVDIMNFGIPAAIFESMGFKEINIQSESVICPNYFEPFEQRNVKIDLAYKCEGEYVCFKGDADQDRPNIL